MESNIRRVDAGEIREALALAWRVFSRFEAPEYAAEGVEEFRRFLQEENIRERMRSGGMILWGWYEGNTIAGMIAVTETGHVNLLFVDAVFQRRGIGRALHNTALNHFRKTGVSKVTVNSSPYAVEIYRRLGFAPVSAERTVSGIRFTPMELFLAPEPAD